ncbi:MAG: response regulator [Gemmatimonadetes bacterium]|nr:response regulator [Gemmatimonadota bacterium]
MKRDDLAARLLATFVGELEEQVRAMNADLLALESAPGDPERLRSLFRAAHTLKGAAHAAGVPLVAAACHEMETLLAAARDGRITLGEREVRSIFTAIDALTDAGTRLRAGEPLDRAPIAAIARGLESAHPPAGREPGARPPAAAPAAPPRAAGTAPERPDGTRAVPVAQLRVAEDKLDVVAGSAGELAVATAGLASLSTRLRELHELAGRCRADWRRLAPPGGDVRARDARARLGAELDRLARESERLAGEASAHARDLARIATGLSDGIRRLRMRPFADACETLPRTVRDVTAAAGKEARLEVRGGEVEADRAVLGGVRDALLHLVRNAVAHGIEAPAERVIRGKPRTGRVEVAASIRGGRLVVAVADDGAGLDLEALRAQVARRGLRAPTDDAELVRMIFRGGLSTRAHPDPVSGRGVGLDAARAAIERVRGTIDVHWVPGAGTTFILECPLSLAMLHVVLVAVGRHVLGVPSADVERMELGEPDRIRHVDGRAVLPDAEAPVPLVSLARLLGPPFEERPIDGRFWVLRLRAGGRRLALIVDTLVGEREVLLRPLERFADTAPQVAGAAMLENGALALILRSTVLLEAGLSAEGAGLRFARRAAEVAPTILVVDDSITTRSLEQSVLEAAGYRVVTAPDGAAAWRLLQEQRVDLIISDVEMPRMDGFALCQAVRASKRLGSLPIVLVTAMEAPEHRSRGLEVGADAYLAKSSFDQQTLLDAIDQLLGRSR